MRSPRRDAWLASPLGRWATRDPPQSPARAGDTLALGEAPSHSMRKRLKDQQGRSRPYVPNTWLCCERAKPDRQYEPLLAANPSGIGC